MPLKKLENALSALYISIVFELDNEHMLLLDPEKINI